MGLPLHLLAAYPFPDFSAVIVLVLLAAGFTLIWRDLAWPAAVASVATWIGLGVFAGSIALQPPPTKHVLSRFAAQQIPLGTPLRWQGVW